MTLQKEAQDLCAGENGLQRDSFEQGIAFIFQWVAMFLAVGELCVILLRELCKTFSKGVSKQNQDLLYLETCLSLSSDPSPTVAEIPPEDEFTVLVIPLDQVGDWLSACESAAGIGEENIGPVEVIASPVDGVVEDRVHTSQGDNGLLLKPQRVRPPYVPKPRKKPPVKPPSTKKGFG